MKKPTVTERPTSWWREKLEQRRTRMQNEQLSLTEPMAWSSDAERRGAIKFFNAAFRAEESGLTQAHQLASEVDCSDPELGRVLRLYGDEEGWHRQLLTEFLAFLGGEATDMGRVTRTFYRWYARAKRMETIVLTNLMFETVGSTTYRLALRNVQQPQARQMLTILTRDESFHVPLNVHFLRQVLKRQPESAKRRLRRIYRLLFVSLVLLPLASRPKAKPFDGIGVLTLSRAYARELGELFARERDLDFEPPRLLLRLLGIRLKDLGRGVQR